MFTSFLKTTPLKKATLDVKKDPKRLSGLVVNPNSMSNEDFFMFLQEIGDFIEDDTNSNNMLSLENGTIQIYFQFLNKHNLQEKSTLSKKDIIILLLNVDGNGVNDQFNFILNFLKETDPNSGGMKNTQLFFLVQNFSYDIHDNSDMEYQISELQTEYPFINVCKVSSDNSSTLKPIVKHHILSFARQDKQTGWSPIMTQEDDKDDSFKNTGYVLDQLEQYKMNRTTSPSPPPQALKPKKSIFENPLVSILKQQQDEKKAQEDILKSQELQQIKSTSRIQSSFYESPIPSSVTKKRDMNNSLIYYNSSSKKTDQSDFDSPLTTLRYRDSEKTHQIKVKMSPFKREISYQMPKLSGEKQLPIFKTSLIQGDEENDDIIQYSNRKKNNNNNSPLSNNQLNQQQLQSNNNPQIKQQKTADGQQKETLENNFIKQYENQNFLDPFGNPNQQKVSQKPLNGELKLNKYSELSRSVTPNTYQEKVSAQNEVQNNKQSNELKRNKSSLGIRQTNKSQLQDRSPTPNSRLSHNRSSKQIIPSSSSSNINSNIIMKLNIEVQNRVIQLDVEEHDTPYSLTYKLLQKCNSSGKLNQVKQITMLIEQQMKKYTTNVDKYFKNYTKPQISHICKQNKQVLQDLTENDYQDVDSKKKQTYNYTGYRGTIQLEKTGDRYKNSSYAEQFNKGIQGQTAQNNKNGYFPQQTTQSVQYSPMLSSIKYIGEIQINGNVNGQQQNLTLQIQENLPAEQQAEFFLKQYNLGLDLKEQIAQQIQQIITQHKQSNMYSELFQENREQASFMKELKAKYRFDNNILFQSIQKSSSMMNNNYRINLELENGKTVRFTFNESDNLTKAINIFCINHKLSSKNQQKLYSLCEQSIKYHRDQQNQKR